MIKEKASSRSQYQVEKRIFKTDSTPKFNKLNYMQKLKIAFIANDVLHRNCGSYQSSVNVIKTE